MAVEMAEEMYLFRTRNTLRQDPVFHANPLHDLESMWWLLTWSVFSHIPESSERLHDAEAVSQQSAARKALFFDKKERLFCLTSQTLFYRHHRSKLDPLLGPLFDGVDEVLATLRNLYTIAENSFPIPTSAFDGVHEIMMASMKENLVGAAIEDKLVRLGAVGKQLLEKERKKNEEEKKRKREQAAEQQPNRRMRLEEQDLVEEA